MDPDKFVISGRHAGMVFGIVGEGFGTAGTLTIGGVHVPTTMWTDRDIRGLLPKELKPGEVVVKSDTGMVQKGVWPAAHSESPNPAAVKSAEAVQTSPSAPAAKT